MKKVIICILIITLLLLSGCSYMPRFPTDSGVVVWHKAKDLNEIALACDPSNRIKKFIYGCYKMSSDNTICNIYSIDDPKHYYVLGHELKHCFDGRFHDVNGDTSKPLDPPKK